MEIEIKEYKYRTTCAVRRCKNRSELAIGVHGESPATDIIICWEHFKEIVEKGGPMVAEKFGIKPAGGAEVTALQAEIELLANELDGLKKTLESRDAEIERLTREKKPAVHTARTAKSVKGGRKK
jgi:hypothetical protein